MTHRFRSAGLSLAFSGFLGLLACGAERPLSPEQTVRAFLDAMQDSAVRTGPAGEVVTDERSLAYAYSLLSRATRASLRERAELAASLAGGDVDPPTMLIPGRFRLRFEPVRFEEVSVDGRDALVRVTGRHAEERADVALVFEEGAWRIPLGVGPAAQTVY